jgi:uncharacterized protein involved in exopolysaccharide biosynthesis
MAQIDTQSSDILEEFLGDTPRATEWRALREALRERLHAMLRSRDLETDPAALTALETQIGSLRKQVAALETEEVVAQFVEDSIKASLARAPAYGSLEGEE